MDLTFIQKLSNRLDDEIIVPITNLEVKKWIQYTLELEVEIDQYQKKESLDLSRLKKERMRNGETTR